MKLLTPELLILAQMCTKSFVGWGFAPDPTGRAYSAPPDPLAALTGPTSKGEGWGGGGKGGEGKGRVGGERKGWEGREGRGQAPPSQNSGSRTAPAQIVHILRFCLIDM